MASIQLKVLHGELQGRVLEFTQTECILLGRSSDALIRLADDPFVSRQHLLMEVCPPFVLVSDLGSRNGFFVNDRHIGGLENRQSAAISGDWSAAAGTAFVSDEDLIVVGTNRFQVSVSPANPQGPSRRAQPVTNAGVLAPASLVGRYRIVREIGRGWMGGAYQAVDTDSGHEVAVKTLVPNIAFSAESADAFLKSLGRFQSLRHPGLTRLKDFGQHGNGFYCVQEFIDGMDLSSLLKLRGGKLDLAEAVPIMLNVLDGLSHAFANGGFVHRNLKPRNILIPAPDREMKATVADFGLFRALELAGLNRTIQSRLHFDAPCYWPRERITFFNRADAASEVFSAAAIFYQMLTGCLVRDGLFELQSRSSREDTPPGLADYLTLMAANPLVPIREREPGIPAGLAELLDRALGEPVIRRGAEDPGATLARERFVDPEHFRAALLEVLPTLPLARTVPGTGG